MIGALTNHVWQSTLFAVAAGLLAALLRKNRAQVRFWLWFSASVKFFVPFSLLISLGSHLPATPGAMTRIASPSVSFTLEQIAEPFAVTPPMALPTQGSVDWFPIAILAVWACGIAAVALFRLRTWLRFRSALRGADTRVCRVETHLDAFGAARQIWDGEALSVEIRSSPTLLECVSGVTGADLKKRIEAIMTRRTGHRLDRAKKFLLAAAGVAALSVPLAIGVVHAPTIRASQSAAPQAEKPLAFAAASIKPVASGRGGRGGPGGGSVFIRPPGSVVGRSASTRKIIEEAYHLTRYQVSGGPAWIDSDRFSLEGKSETPATDPQLRQMLQTLLGDRFQLVAHSETREMPVYILTVGKTGLKVPELKEGDPTPTHVHREGITSGPAMILSRTMQGFAEMLSANPLLFDRPVVDNTGLQGIYFFGLQWSEDENFITVMQQEFGLKLESKKAPMDVLVIDRIEKPSEN